MLYRGMDRAALDAAYTTSASIPNVDGWRQGWLDRSAAFRKTHQGKIGIPYTKDPTPQLDFFPAENPKAPTVMFLHGGYWQRNSKDTFSFVAEGFLAHGFNAAIVGYTLAPHKRLPQIVAEVGEAATWLHKNLGSLGADPEKLYMTGWSAGGHLAAMNMAHPAIKGALAVSGLYDMEPIRLGSVNDVMGLDEAEARSVEPMSHIPTKAPPLIVSAGGGELPEFRRQATDYAAACKAKGLKVRYIEPTGCHHYSALDELAKPEGQLAKAFAKLVKTGSLEE